MSDPFVFKKSINKKVAKAAQEILKTEVISVARIRSGIVNYVYKIETPKKAFVVRVFRNIGWPEDGKLEWIEKQLTKHKVPHAKTMFYDRSNKYFPFGLMVSEFIDGRNAWTAVSKREQSIADSYRASGRILKMVHRVKLPKFGKINYGKGEDKSFLLVELKKASDHLAPLIKLGLLNKNVTPQVQKAVNKTLKPFERRFKPVLVHGDATRDNSILLKNGNFILIDWDNAKSRIALWDYCYLTSWWAIQTNFWNHKKMEVSKRSFFEGYGPAGFSDTEIERIQPAIHILIYIGMMKFFLLDKKNKEMFKKIKNQFNKLLNYERS
jgi:aminoglycoside phosphotransferase (APT) family kinase protein